MLVNGDSWISVTDADTYFSKKYGQAFWSALSLTEKEQLLVTAKIFILSMGYSISDDEDSQKVKNAQCETVQFIYEFYPQFKKRANLTASGVKSFRVLNFSETLQEQKLPVYISAMIEDFKTNKSSFIGVLKRELND